MTSEDKRKHALKVISILEETYPDARVALNFSNPLELLVATVLSAQCTDERVNKVTKHLFKKYKRAEDYANVDLKELEEDVKQTGFYKRKARFLKKIAEAIVEKFNSQVPKTMKEMLSLPGVARKTANIVLSNAYGVLEGIAVDTHVLRLARRLSLSSEKDRDKVEKDLMALFPRDMWLRVTDLLITHGRRVCKARKPDCEACVINNLCPSASTLGRSS